MSIAYNGNIYRNLEEQVLQNQHDIEDISNTNKLGIAVVGTVSYADDLPDPLTYPGNYGEAYTVGVEAPYDIYVFTRPYAGQTEPHWFNLGPIMIVGPAGPVGPAGSVGPQGIRGTRWSASATNPVIMPDTIIGDVHVNTTTGNMYIYGTAGWQLQGSIRGPQGATGERGETGQRGQQGIQGIQGPQGVPGSAVTIVAIVTNTDQLPPPTEDIRNNAYLVGTPGQYSIYIITGTTSLTWENAGPFDLTDQIKAEALDAIMTATNPIIKTNTGTTVNISIDPDALPRIIRL